MFVGNAGIIDVEVHTEDREAPINSELIHESIHESIHWILACEAKHLTGLDQSGFTRMIKELTQAHQIPIAVLRRGQARNTEYSQIAIDLAKLLNFSKPGNQEAFEKIKQSLLCPPTVKVGTIRVLQSIEQNTEIARHSSYVADQNLATIGNQISSLMAKYRRLGESLGSQAGAEFEEGFTSGVSRSIGKISEV